LLVLYLFYFATFFGCGLLITKVRLSGHLILALFVALQLLLIRFDSNPTAQVILLFVLSVTAHEMLPEFQANLWVVGFGIAAMIGFGLLTANPVLGALIGLGAFGGFSYLGSAARSRRVAEAARAESQHLLQELQVAHAQLQAHAHEAQMLAATEERNRVARELHDTLGHRLTVAAVQLEGAQRLIDRDATKASIMVGVVRGQVVDALGELRQTVAALRTPIEADLALPAAITLLANHFATATALPVHVQIAAEAQPYLAALSQSARHTLYRAAQEGLTNVQKHAHATAAWITLGIVEDAVTATPTVQLVVHDNGRGLATNGDTPRGFGLAGLAERAAQHDGTMHLAASPYGGYALTVTLPFALSLTQPTP
jgi:signal transduction histidine kinase